MISLRGLDIARIEAMNRYEEYEKLANSCVDDEALYGFLKGFADASLIVNCLIPDIGGNLDKDKCESLYAEIDDYAGFKCTSKRGKDGDCLKNFRKGREAGCKAAIASLKMISDLEYFTEDA